MRAHTYAKKRARFFPPPPKKPEHPGTPAIEQACSYTTAQP